MFGKVIRNYLMKSINYYFSVSTVFYSAQHVFFNLKWWFLVGATAKKELPGSHFSRIFRIRTEYGEILRISSYSIE